jgi:hypothetical protein
VGNCLIEGRIRDLAMFNLAHLVSDWIGSIGLDPHLFGTHLLRRTKATLIYRRTGNLRAVQLLLGHIQYPYSITSSAVASSPVGTVMPSGPGRSKNLWRAAPISG